MPLVDMDNNPQEWLIPVLPLLREQSHTWISRTSAGCFVKKTQTTDGRHEGEDGTATAPPHVAKKT